MRAHTITTISRRRRSARRRRVLALALGVCALAIPATATAQANDSAKSANSITGGSSESSQPSGYSSVNAITGVPASEPTLVTSSPGGTSDGFDWVSALVGAGAALALAALGGAALLTVRRRAPVPLPAPTG